MALVKKAVAGSIKNIKVTGIYNYKAIIAVDFDRTCVNCSFPHTHGSIGAEQVLKELIASGHGIVLWTLRNGQALKDAEDWFRYHDIPLLAVNDTVDAEVVARFGYSRKINFDLLIDDNALGIPTITDTSCKYPYVDWKAVSQLLRFRNLLTSV